MNFYIAIYLLFLCHCIHYANAQEFAPMEDIQLSVPIAHYHSTLFEDSVALHFSPTYPGSSIHYTTDGTNPTLDSPIFGEKQYFRSSISIKAAVFHSDLQSSPILSIDFVKASRLEDLKNIRVLTQPNEKYTGQGEKSLVDLKKGTLDFRNPAWMGFDTRKVEIQIKLKKSRKIQKVVISTMVNHGSWIFLPEQVEIRTKKTSFASKWEIPLAEEASRLVYLTIPLEGVKTKHLYITIQNAEAIPDWHSGAGASPWLFIDEILIE